MSSPDQKRGACGHVMVIFDSHSVCACCRDKGKEKDPCVENPQCSDCKFCNHLTPDQKAQLATPSYKLKKEKREARKLETDSSSTTPVKDSVHSPNPSFVDPASVQVIRAVDGHRTLQSPCPVELAGKKKRVDKDKATTSKSKSHSEKPVKSTKDSTPTKDSTNRSPGKTVLPAWSQR